MVLNRLFPFFILWNWIIMRKFYEIMLDSQLFVVLVQAKFSFGTKKRKPKTIGLITSFMDGQVVVAGAGTFLCSKTIPNTNYTNPSGFLGSTKLSQRPFTACAKFKDGMVPLTRLLSVVLDGHTKILCLRPKIWSSTPISLWILMDTTKTSIILSQQL